MIAWLRGVVREHDDEAVVLEVHGVGWLVYVTALDRAALAPGATAELLIHQVVREDAMLLYGFRTRQGRELFLALLSVPSVGPKGAMALLSELTPTALAHAIHQQDVRTLTRAKGIGKRGAELIVVRLRERLPPALAAEALAPAPAPSRHAPALADLESALTNLGYRPADARAAAQDAVERGGEGAGFDALLRLALAALRPSGRAAKGGAT
jgi:Holliday junction DNA helicase RuvA